LERVIAASIRMKAEVVGEDEREAGLRMILNFGHTVGHAIEAVAGFGKVLHGGAVGWGMIAALEISKLRGLPEKEYWAGTGIVLDYGLPKLPALSASKLLDATARDKKNLDGLRRFVLLESLGKAYVTEDVTEAELYSAILSMLKMTPRPVRA
jgi:3-dehydroquinate synthase